jgi:hypothetical protein
MPTPIIDETYFRAELQIAQLGQLAVREHLQMFIDQREPECLQTLLGPALHEAFRQRTTPLDKRWEDLVKGCAFMIGSRWYQWNGLQGLFKRSPVAAYIYYWYQRDFQTVTTGIGEVKPKGGNSSPADANSKMINAWNLFAEACSTIRLFLTYHRDINGELAYPEYRVGPPAESYEVRPINVFGI